MEVSKPEVDNSGYDLIIEANGFLRHVQLKTAFVGAETSRQNIHVSLAKKQSGCVVWIYFNQDTLELGPFLFFGGQPGDPLPDISSFETAKHTKGDSSGLKKERSNVRVVKKRKFEEYSTVKDIYKALFTYEAGLTMTLEDLGKKLHEMYFESDCSGIVNLAT